MTQLPRLRRHDQTRGGLAIGNHQEHFSQFPKRTEKAITDMKYVYITPIHNEDVETRQTQGWKIVDKHPTNPDYTLMTKTVEE